jgi:hypothetical protein
MQYGGYGAWSLTATVSAKRYPGRGIDPCRYRGAWRSRNTPRPGLAPAVVLRSCGLAEKPQTFKLGGASPMRRCLATTSIASVALRSGVQ